MKRQFRWPWRDFADIRTEVDEETQFHLDMRTEKLMSEGLDRRDARDKALQEFGDMEKARRSLRKADIRNETRRRRSERLFEIAYDLKHAARTLRRSPAFTLTAILTLALGIAATTIVFSFMDGVLLQPLPFDKPEQLISVSGFSSPPDFVDARKALEPAASIAAFHYNSVVLTTESSAERIQAVRVTPGFFEVLAAVPAIGRVISEQDAIPDRDKFIILSHDIWRSSFAADPGLVGRSIRIDGEPRVVIGIMPAGFAYPANAKAWLPKSFTTRDLTTQRGAHYLDVIGRLEPPASIDSVRARLSALATQLQQQQPNTNAKMKFDVQDLKESLVANYRLALLVLMAAGLCLLLIACANVAGLTLVRTLDRAHELALRAALGAGRFRITRTLLSESVIVAAIGGAIGVALAVWGVDVMVALEAGRVPRLTNVHIDLRSMAFATGVASLSMLSFGLLPTFRIIRSTNLRGWIAARSKGRMQSILVAAEVALTLVLLMSAGLLLRTFINLQRVDPGFTVGNVLTFDLSLPKSRYAEPRQARAFYAEFQDRVRRLPGVTAVSSVSGLPLTDYHYVISVEKLDGVRAYQGPGDEKYVQVRVASPEYARVIGLRVIRGRFFDGQDREDAPPAAVVTEAAARSLWPNQDAIGRTIEIGTGLGLGGPRVGGTVVGIVADYHDFGVRQPRPPVLFVAHSQFPVADQTITIQTAGNPGTAVELVRAELRNMDREVPMADVREFKDVVSDALAEDRSYAVLVGVYASLALILAAIGIYGITAYSVTQRTREFGVRLALGATPARILGTVLQRSIGLTIIGVMLGLMCALMVTRSLEKMLFALSPTDPITLVAVACGVLVVALFASWLPARRAERVDPTTALRTE